jgi:hypothetical protein
VIARRNGPPKIAAADDARRAEPRRGVRARVAPTHRADERIVGEAGGARPRCRPAAPV